VDPDRRRRGRRPVRRQVSRSPKVVIDATAHSSKCGRLQEFRGQAVAIKTAPAAGQGEGHVRHFAGLWGRGLAISAMLLAAVRRCGGSGRDRRSRRIASAQPHIAHVHRGPPRPRSASKNILATFTSRRSPSWPSAFPRLPPCTLADLHITRRQPITITVAANTTEMTPGPIATIRVATAAQDQSVDSPARRARDLHAERTHRRILRRLTSTSRSAFPSRAPRRQRPATPGT